MKQLIILLIFFISTIILKAQTPSLCISSDKTTSLVFPYPVVHIDRGTKDVLVQQVKEANNVVLVKAAFKNIPETNLSVVTDEGSVYSFSICYNDNLTTWIYTIPENKVTATKTYANCILDNPPAAWGMHGESWDMSANVIGIYIKSNTIYYQMRIRDFGPIDYDIDFIRFYIRDKKRSKRTASQEIELKPFYVLISLLSTVSHFSIRKPCGLLSDRETVRRNPCVTKFLVTILFGRIILIVALQ